MARVDGFISGALQDQLGTNRKVPYAITNPPVQLTGPVGPALNFLSSGAQRSVLGPSVGARLSKRVGGVVAKTHGDDFFENVYILPREIDAGTILSDQVYSVEVYNAYRSESRSWTGYDDSALGAGFILDSPIPPPPTIILAKQSGSVHTLTIQLKGPPTLNGTMDFTLDIGTFSIPVTGSRSTLFPFQPEGTLVEKLIFRTNVLTALSGKEQRRALRKTPRVELEMTVAIDEQDRNLFNNILFDGQERPFGVPLWYEATELAAPIAVNDTVITVNSTAYADFRVGGLAVVWTDPFNFETLEVASTTATTVTFASPFTSAHGLPALVMPVLPCFARPRVEVTRRRVQLQTARLVFTALDNDVDIASTAAFSAYDSKVLLDEPNLMDGEVIRENLTKVYETLDFGTGAPFQSSSQDVSRAGSSKGFVIRSRQQLWEVRQLLHALRGRAVSFYLPTFYPDFEVAAPVSPADTVVDVINVKYTDSVQSRASRNVIRLHKTDGTSTAPKLVTGASEPSVGIDRLSIAPDTMSITAALSDIERLELIQKVRLDDDTLRIEHTGTPGEALIFVPVKAVLE